MPNVLPGTPEQEATALEALEAAEAALAPFLESRDIDIWENDYVLTKGASPEAVAALAAYTRAVRHFDNVNKLPAASPATGERAWKPGELELESRRVGVAEAGVDVERERLGFSREKQDADLYIDLLREGIRTKELSIGEANQQLSNYLTILRDALTGYSNLAKYAVPADWQVFPGTEQGGVFNRLGIGGQGFNVNPQPVNIGALYQSALAAEQGRQGQAGSILRSLPEIPNYVPPQLQQAMANA